MTADLSLLDTRIRALYDRHVADLTAKGYNCHATTTYRAPEVENALASSVTSVTASTSKHCTTLADGTPAARAYDLSFFDANGAYISNGAAQCYTDAGALWLKYAAEPDLIPLKLVWGGTWHHPHDPDHFQIA
jgi:hypothetical protein